MLADKIKCTGCGVCSAICPVSAIDLAPDKEEFLRPIIDSEICTDCGKCSETCPVLIAEKLKTKTHNIVSYAAYINDADKLASCASGGIATAFYESVLDRGGFVCGVVYNKDFTKASYVCTDSRDYLEAFKGSKYIQAEKGDIYKTVKEKLDEGKEVLFVGLPCEVAAIKAFLGRDYDKLTLVDLICYGPTSPLVAKLYLKYLKMKKEADVVEFSVRYKKGAWQPSYLRALLDDNVDLEEYIIPFFDTDYGYAFNMMARPSCYKCEFKGDVKSADITIGDFWGADKSADYYNSMGTSAVCVHTDRGAKFLSETSNISLTEVDYDIIEEGNPLLVSSRKPNGQRNNFSELIRRQGLRIVVDAYRVPPEKADFKSKVKRFIKRLLYKKEKVF